MSQGKTIEPLISFCSRYNGFPINEWLSLPDFHMNLYARRSKRAIESKRTETIDLASFEILSQFRGAGLFTSFLEQVEIYASENNLVIFIECVHNDRLREFLKHREYTSIIEENSFFKKPKIR